MSLDYTEQFYDVIARGSIDSANIVAPMVMEFANGNIATVVDVGCGQGWWGKAFADLGCLVTGVDGDYVECVLDEFIPQDLALYLAPMGTFDLAVCLEVAEHLPESRAASFVSDLCDLSDTVLFSAAIPYQTGAGHITLRWPSFWSNLFAAHDYGVIDTLRWEIWNDPRVEPWYRQNIMIFQRGMQIMMPRDVVHPTIHAWGRT